MKGDALGSGRFLEGAGVELPGRFCGSWEVGLRGSVEIEGCEDVFPIDLDLAVEAKEAGARREEGEDEGGAAAEVVAEDFAAGGVEMHDSLVVVVEADEMGEGVHDRLEPFGGAAVGFSD